jgi:MFS family permease
MRDLLINVSALLLSISFLLLGNGLQMTLLGVRAQIEDFSTVITGFLTSAYFIGYIIGALTIPRMVEIVGHIRVFVALASASSIATILHVAWIDPYFWALLRIITGFCLVGLYLVTESWLNEAATNENRGTVFSSYMVVNLASVGLGQQLLQVADPAGYGPFILVTILFSLAVVPIALAPVRTPGMIPSERMKIKKLYLISPVGTLGSFMAGLVSGAFWGMAAVYLFTLEFTTREIANFMMIVVLCGMALQWPLGKLSDKIDRRLVIALCCIGISTAATFIIMVDPQNSFSFYSTAFLLGGFLMSINSLCTAHTNDYLSQKDFVQASGTLLLVFGLGAMTGPYAASIGMQFFGDDMLFVFIIATSLVLFSYTFIRRFIREAPAVRLPFKPVPLSTQHLMKWHKAKIKKS